MIEHQEVTSICRYRNEGIGDDTGNNSIVAHVITDSPLRCCINRWRITSILHKASMISSERTDQKFLCVMLHVLIYMTEQRNIHLGIDIII